MFKKNTKVKHSAHLPGRLKGVVNKEWINRNVIKAKKKYMLSMSFGGIIATMNPPCTGSPGILLVVENALKKAMKSKAQETKAASSGLGVG